MVTPNYVQAQVLAVEGEGTVEMAAGDTSSDAKPVDNQGTASPGMFNPNVFWNLRMWGSNYELLLEPLCQEWVSLLVTYR